MRRLRSFLLIVLAALGAALGEAWAQTPTLPPDGGSRLDSPTCETLDLAGRPAGSFRAGDELVLRGEHYPAGELVLVSFRQPPYSAELARFRTDGNGAFTSEPTILRVPADSVAGFAEIHVSSSGGSGSCALSLTGTAAPVTRPAPAGPTARPTAEPEESNPWLIVWATLVALVGGYLAFVTYRRWQADRLEKRVSRLGADGGRSGGRPHPEDLAGSPGTTEDEQPPGGPPILPVGWDAGMEPTPMRRPHGDIE